MANRNATGGDSGGPWVDSNGKLLAMHSGWRGYFTNEWDVGTVGHPALDAVGAELP